MRISLKNVSYEEMKNIVDKISKEYEDVYIEVKPSKGSFYAHVVIRSPEVEIAKIL